MIVDDSGKNAGKKRESLLNPEFKNIAISSIMFYHRIYDFVILIFPLILICRDWDSEYLIDKVIRIVTIANLVLVFYGFRILQLGVMVPRCCYNTIMFILTTLLLTALLFKDQNCFLLSRCRIK